MPSQTRSFTASASIVTGWTDVANVYSSNDARAVAGLTTAVMAAYTAEFTIPAGATIDGIVASVEGHGNQAVGARRQLTVALTKDSGANQAGDAATVIELPQTTDSTQTRGGATDLWGATWTVSEINASGFGVRLQPSGQSNSSYERRVDHVEVTVHYTAAPAELAADPGSYAVTGSAAALEAQRELDADPGSYAVAGSPVEMATEGGSAASLWVGRKDATGGADTWGATLSSATRSAAVLVEVLAGELPGEFALDADPGSYAVSGAAAGLEAGRGLSADPGSYAVTGADAALEAGQVLDAQPGAYAVSGSRRRA
jgi:hypothetical protein